MEERVYLCNFDPPHDFLGHLCCSKGMLLVRSHVCANTVRDQHLETGLQEQVLRRRERTEESKCQICGVAPERQSAGLGRSELVACNWKLDPGRGAGSL